jgi:hypothetical protein
MGTLTLKVNNRKIVQVDYDGKKGRKQEPEKGDPVEEHLACLCGDYAEEEEQKASQSRARMMIASYTCCARTATGQIIYWVQGEPCG